MRLLNVAVVTGHVALIGDGEDLLLEVGDEDGGVTAVVAFESADQALSVARNIQAWAEKAIARRAEGDG